MKKLSLLLVSVLFCSFLKAQLIDSMLQVYAAQVPDQKVHVHFDKDLYKAGESIWFKAYIFSGFSPADNSHNFYAELVNDKGVVLQRKVYPVLESTAFGNFDLPDSLPAGTFTYRGYTQWMLNFDSAFIFRKSIVVVDKNGLPGKSAAPRATNPTIQFFPEGGNLVNQLESVVAFKANDEYGVPVPAKGTVVNSKGETVATFDNRHDGMGTFKLTPAAGETYQANWVDATGKSHTTPLPEVKAQGYVISVVQAGKNKMFKLARTDDVPEDWKKVYVVAILSQVRVYKAMADFTSSKVTSGTIPTGELPSGVLQVTIFSEGWQPIAERVVMVNNNNYTFDASVNSPVLNTANRAKNTLEVQVNDTLFSNMSLSVTDAAIGRQNYGDNIISRMLLTGDIKGAVYNPGYYFQNTSDSVAANLDLVMMTHGWRRYNWGMLARGRKPQLKYPNDVPLTLEAKVFGVTTASPLRNDEEMFVMLQSKDSTTQVFEMPKTGTDKFSVTGLTFFDTANVYYQFMKDKNLDKSMALAFNNNFYKGPAQVSVGDAPVQLLVDTSMLARTRLLTERQARYGSKFDPSGNVLQTVTVKTRTKSKLQQLDEKYASGLFKGDDGYSFDLTETPAYAFDIFTYLQGKVAGLQITGQGANTSLSWRGSNTALFLNEMPADVGMISSLSVNDVAYIKVIRPPFMGGGMQGGAGGAVAIYTKKGGDVKREPGKGLPTTRVSGYSSTKEFYIPNYKDMTELSNVPADYRSTLLWKPLVTTDATRQKVRFDFYNNDITRAFRIVLEGINEYGKLVRIEKVVQAQ